ncbi:Protein CBG26201 [Caenorhabditis briggsae]|uniref:Protein CBG26201 n=1 Tax=Caenorhabditis briggsae TaxID=6238 RepID=B6ILU6_CAEBR|nr:Protein CBG26201 [Caenorhabditis briggsae]CAS00876.1 Protein CBG26201 [Caenorhabditis briggsae]
MSNPQALQMDSEDVEFVEDNQAQPDAQPEAQPIFNNDLQGPVLTPMLYAAMVQPFMAKIVEQQKTIEGLEEKNRDLLLQQPLNFWKRVEEAAILQEPVVSPPTAAPVKPTSFEEGVQLWRTNGFRNIKIPNIDMSRLLFSPTKGILQQCVTKVSNGIMLYNMSLRSLWRQPKLNLRTYYLKLRHFETDFFRYFWFFSMEHWDKLSKETQNEWCGKGLILAKWQNIQVDLGLILLGNLRDGKLPY